MIIDPSRGRSCVTTEPMSAGANIAEIICPGCSAVVPVTTPGVRNEAAVAAAATQDCPLHELIHISPSGGPA